MSIASELQHDLDAVYIETSSSVLFLFDYVITLSQEIDVIWTRKPWTFMTWLYAVTRYTTIVISIWTFIPVFPGMTDCKVNQYTSDILAATQLVCSALFSALRVYALLDGNKVISGAVLLLNIVPFATNMDNFATGIVVEDGRLCTTAPGVPEHTVLSLSLATRIAVTLSDVIILIVTWAKTAQLYKESQRLNIKAPLATMVLRDGTLYFIILLIINILQVVGANIPILSAIKFSQPFFVAIPPLIICRFILNLRQVDRPGNYTGSIQNQSVSLRFVGNMGQSLQYNTDEDHDDMLDEIPSHTRESDYISNASVHRHDASTQMQVESIHA